MRYSSHLEQTAFTGRSGAYIYMYLFGVCSLLILATYLNDPFFGTSLTFMVVYVWGRLNKHLRLSLFGLIRFQAPTLVWMLLGLACFLRRGVTDHLLGICVGHLYYFLAFVYPEMTGVMLLKTPRWLLQDDELPDAVSLDNFE